MRPFAVWICEECKPSLPRPESIPRRAENIEPRDRNGRGELRRRILPGTDRDSAGRRRQCHQRARVEQADEGNAGPCAWAARSNDVPREAKRLAGAGVTVATPENGGRNRPDGVRLDWQTAQVGQQPRGTFFPFLIHDSTPRDARVFPRTGQPRPRRNSRESRACVIAVRDLGSAVAQYRKAYDLEAPQQVKDSTIGAQLAVFEGTPVVLADPVSPHHGSASVWRHSAKVQWLSC